MSSKVVMAISRGILKAYNKQILAGDELEDDEARSDMEYTVA